MDSISAEETAPPRLHALPEEVPEGRLQILAYLKKELIGPAGGYREEIEGEAPHKRYTLGVLFPRDVKSDDQIADEEEEVKGSTGKEDLTDDPVTLSGQWMPSSMGLSFYFTGAPEIRVNVSGSRYVRLKDGKEIWVRNPVPAEDQNEAILLTPEADHRCERNVLEGDVSIQARWRKIGKGFLVTVTLVNNVSKKGKEINGEDCLCQAGFQCRVVSGQIQEYPSVNLMSRDPEELELQLLYRHKKVFAIGHGCSADWDTSQSVPDVLSTEVMPVAYVPAMTLNLEEDPFILSVSRLANQSLLRKIILEELLGFIQLYDQWTEKLESRHTDIPERLQPAKKEVIRKLKLAYSRMQEGIACLGKNDIAWEAFQLANLSMLIQMRHSRSDLAGSRHERNQVIVRQDDYLGLDYKWRPFQLAFQLLTIESVINPDSRYREAVDLIWFPTGGGKTEAYLAIAAFELFYRRLKHGEKGAGTAVITRYTLRLLTSQQFQRSARLIAACEYLRRKDKEKLGNAPFSIGFWGGKDISPNTYAQAVEVLSDIKTAESPAAANKFQLDACPWCGTELLPQVNTENKADFGFVCDNTSFRVFCPSEACLFHDSIPVSVVDDDLYKFPPSFLIATVDKFARLAWVDGGGAFFGRGKYLPPSLVIQDELHLLSGPLGTTVGLYESAFEGLMSFYDAKPKIIASTATIRNAGFQVKSLFGRDVMLFPSPGLSADDSFFAKTDETRKGRLYVGVMSSNHRATTSAVRTAAALLQAVKEQRGLSEAEKDAYWTLVMYHMSLRELGKTVSFSRDDIPARIKVIANAEDNVREISDDDVLELTSNLHAADIPESLKRMEKYYREKGSVSVVACTNMLSVGVDVPRLGLMMINGQPKTTSEYIQASSRVGRGNIPGLVLTHYSASKPRDRSHYESFLAYHSSLYRFVEPASVTPFSLPARNRALHAALVILIRHGAGLNANQSAIEFDPSNPKIQRAVQILRQQAAIKDPSEAANTNLHIDKLVQFWKDKAEKARKTRGLLYYEDQGKQTDHLLIDFGSEGKGWPTLHSMRSVDAQCKITVIGEKNNSL